MVSRDPVRDQQLAKLIHEEAHTILQCAEDNRLSSLRVVHVEPRPGGKAFLLMFGPPLGEGDEDTGIADAQEAQDILDRAQGYIRSELATALNLKSAPDIILAPDPELWASWEQEQ